MTASLTPARDAPSAGSISPAAPRAFRPDIQALRAVAVSLVLLNHLWPLRVTGGYVGVDVFFVISGFLITSHLGRELFATGRVRLGAFYARRARRLLPAALLVLAFGAIATMLWVPMISWPRAATEIAASAFYVENWVLSALSVDYSAQNDAATVAQHYWSLSVEEQFYLIWPLAMMLAWMAARTASPTRRRAAVALTLAGIGVISLVAGIWMTWSSPAQAYFVTFTRAWEFAAGALLALAAHRLRLPRAIAEIASLLGFALILASALLFDQLTPFPGVAALVPVLGTLLVIAAGGAAARLIHERVSSLRPVQWLGDVSYSVYLWHWPLIVILPFVLLRPMTTLDKVGVLLATLVLAWLTRRFVESPGQRWTWARSSARRTFGAMVAGMAAIAVLSGGIAWGYAMDERSRTVPTDPPTAESCEGPNAVSDAAQCESPFAVPAKVVAMGERNAYYQTPDACGDLLPLLEAGDERTTRVCDYSDGSAAATDVWLIGDSHAQQWQWALFDMAREHGWRLTISFLGGCPPAEVAFAGYGRDKSDAKNERCMRWGETAAAHIERERPAYVFTSSFTRKQLVDDGTGRPAEIQYAEGLTAYWSRWTAAGATVVVLGDPPFNAAVRDRDCVLLNASDPLRCAVGRDVAQPPDPMLLAARSSADPGVIAFDPTPYFCDEGSCYGVIGGVPAYFDGDHLNVEYTRLLRPFIEDAVPGLG
ncbi:acyltransferase family protein [Agromyces salentinus]|uniref:Acyltransferase family protein n=1 Tax=Agromyces salentinus TaxID=269421 RepID=A0ABP4YPB7_9MICO|nr:acyltransferase family protein [Agromyces salentinus]